MAMGSVELEYFRFRLLMDSLWSSTHTHTHTHRVVIRHTPRKLLCWNRAWGDLTTDRPECSITALTHRNAVRTMMLIMILLLYFRQRLFVVLDYIL